MPTEPRRRRSDVWKQDSRTIAMALVVTVATFIADLQLPLDIDITAPYGIVVLLALFIRIPGFAFWSAIVVTILTGVGAWLSPTGAPSQVAHAIVTRVLTLVGIWVTAWLI